jgi:hypothetical protein
MPLPTQKRDDGLKLGAAFEPRNKMPQNGPSAAGALCLAALFVIVWCVPVLESSVKFGRPFFVQFFLSPFQMFILLPWGLCVFCLIQGYMPLKRGGRVERDGEPGAILDFGRILRASRDGILLPQSLDFLASAVPATIKSAKSYKKIRSEARLTTDGE